MFKKATKAQAKLRLTLDGPAGSGKTYSALVLAKALGGRTALIDTEHGSASKYANTFNFDVAVLSDFSLQTYMKAIAAAAAAKYDNLIIDSLTHAWTGKGGALEQVDSIEERVKFTKGWRTVSPLHTRLVDTMLCYPGHLITTMRTKMEYILETKDGKQVPRKVGMAPVQREGMEYEFDVIVDLDIDGHITITKSRCSELHGSTGLLKHEDVASLGERLKVWLSDGAPVPDVVPESAPLPPPTPLRQPVLVPPSAHPETSEWSTDGAPASPLARIEVALAEAQTRSDVDKVVVAIKALPKLQQDAIRPAFKTALERVNVPSQR